MSGKVAHTKRQPVEAVAKQKEAEIKMFGKAQIVSKFIYTELFTDKVAKCFTMCIDNKNMVKIVNKIQIQQKQLSNK